jgi:hypothetical protein
VSSAYKDAIPFVLILFILFFVPRGLFGARVNRSRLRMVTHALRGTAARHHWSCCSPAASSSPTVSTWSISRSACAINAVIVLGLNLLIGFAGQISMGHAGFVGIGAFATAVLPTHLHWHPADWRMAAGAAAAGLLAALVARPIFKPEGELPGDGDARLGHHHQHRAAQRGALHRWARRHAGATLRPCSAFELSSDDRTVVLDRRDRCCR